jgi:hypothetical protein
MDFSSSMYLASPSDAFVQTVNQWSGVVENDRQKNECVNDADHQDEEHRFEENENLKHSFI